jgi:hypothetical protein
MTARALVLALLAAVATARAGGPTLEGPPQYGIYYDRPEPSFYTGFAPRTLDPHRIHVHLGRGDQFRLTVVLADDVLREYTRDLHERARTYRALVDGGRLVLTQNEGLAEFERTLGEIGLDRLVAEEAKLAPAALRERNLALLERLNPGLVFHLRMPLDDVIRRWQGRVLPDDARAMSAERRVELLNAMLPTRLFVAEVAPEEARELDALVKQASAGADPRALRPAFVRLLDHVGRGFYPAAGDALVFDEFTAIYPVGTWNDYTVVHGRQIPAYPTPGRHAFTTHQRTKTPDHVPTDTEYSYFPWLPYIHIGTRMHDAVHTLWWTMPTAETSFLPAAWRADPHRYLWLLSRGPMSHGCTHLNAGHISELRQVLPAETEQLFEVDVFLNTSPLYDVFDIDGDGTPEVMGVRYFIAYALDKANRPDHLRAPNERHAYYDWLYGGELEYDGQDRGVFRRIRDCRFVDRKAVDGAEYERIALHEAAYEPEKIQFYRLVDVDFARELRKVSVRHPFRGVGGTAMSAR